MLMQLLRVFVLLPRKVMQQAAFVVPTLLQDLLELAFRKGPRKVPRHIPETKVSRCATALLLEKMKNDEKCQAAVVVVGALADK